MRPKIVLTRKVFTWQTVGKPENKVDAVKLAQGKPAFAADIEKRGMLVAKVLHSPHAHARIKSIDASKARAIPGVAAVLTWQDIPRVVYSTAGQSDPIPGPLDTFSLDNKVRFVGDRVAFVAAETAEIAEKAVSKIEVEYEVLDAILDSDDSMKPGAIQIHDEPEYVNFADSDPTRNLAAEIRIDIGDVEKGFAEADKIFEAEYMVPKVQQAHIEPHVCVTYWDEDDRLVIRTSTQVPFHVRRMLAPVLDLPVKRIRVIKPRIGGGFGGKQEVLMEDVAAHLTIATKRPVIYEYTREEEFIAARSRHPMKIRMKTGVKKDGTITANEMYALSDTGANGAHALTVTGNTGHKSMALYVGDGEYRKSPNIRFYADIVYTNTPPSGAYRGYGVPQGYWPLDRHMEKIARAMDFDPIEFRLKNAIRPGEYHPFSTAWNEGREPRPEIIHTVGLEQCVQQGKAAIGWDQKFDNEEWQASLATSPHKRKGIGVATVMQGTAIPYLDMGGASIKMNDDASFNLLVGATDLGTGSDTVLAQMAAEVLGVPLEDIHLSTRRTPISHPSIKARMRLQQPTFRDSSRQSGGAGRGTDQNPRGEDAGSGRPHQHQTGRQTSYRARWKICPAVRNRARYPAPQRAGTDHGHRLVRLAVVAATVCGAVRGSDRGHGNRPGHGGQAGYGGRFGRDRQSAHGWRADRRRDDPGARLCRLRRDALRRERDRHRTRLRPLSHLPRGRDA